VPDGIFSPAYEALGRGDAGPLLDLLAPDFEWEEPSELPGYPLAGVHRGAEGFTTGVLAPLAELLEGLTFSVSEVVVGDDREVVCGVMRGVPAGGEDEWELPFAHVWTVVDGAAVRGVAFFDRSRLTLAASRRQLADVADELLEQAGEIRQQWNRLGDALRAAGVEATDDVLAGSDEDESAEPRPVATASARLVAVDMASEGSTREEVDEYLREDLGVEDTSAILAEVFDGAPGDESSPVPARPGSLDPSRLTKLFARNRG
jgi:ketosteroid isomerase-like protein